MQASGGKTKGKRKKKERERPKLEHVAPLRGSSRVSAPQVEDKEKNSGRKGKMCHPAFVAGSDRGEKRPQGEKGKRRSKKKASPTYAPAVRTSIPADHIGGEKKKKNKKKRGEEKRDFVAPNPDSPGACDVPPGEE